MVVMESSEAVKFIVEEVGVEDAEVLDVKEGFHNRNFIVKTSSRNLVVREQIGNPLGSKGLENEKIILKFMEHKGLESMPRSVFYSGEEDIHVIEFLEGSEQLVEEIDATNGLKNFSISINSVSMITEISVRSKIIELENFQLQRKDWKN